MNNALFLSDLSNQIGLTQKIHVTINITEFFSCLIYTITRKKGFMQVEKVGNYVYLLAVLLNISENMQ